MQLRKPVLLEGSPGVGKTACINALANASGHRLTRINLSEQTDISDLVGSDLPMPETDNTGSIKVAFRWCDGVLLRAIKNGDWVLLDELNLATQSVLEGLNSILDHRNSVFIPELGKTYTCPSSFRVFAAQNPLSQGGGRKGLPKSFLNRFTKVYVDTLSPTDLNLIVATNFPNQTASDMMVSFNSALHNEVVVNRSFGHAGAPWEFNLRDIFRWGELLSIHPHGNNQSYHFKCARDLYIQRFRSTYDREKVQNIYNRIFDNSKEFFHTNASPFIMKISQSNLVIGDVVLPRRNPSCPIQFDNEYLDSSVPLALNEALEAVSRSIAMNWPCLIVEKCGSGKDAILRTLATLSNAELFEVSLSASSDVSELIGCFEQVDRHHEITTVLKGLKGFALDLLTKGIVLSSSEEIWNLVFHLGTPLEMKERLQETFINAIQLLRILISMKDVWEREEWVNIMKIQERLDNLQAKQCDVHQMETHFAWKDGVLVDAMINGYWLHLRNANLCPSSVLDRLNSVMEPGGSLLMAECGLEISESGTTHREVKRHPNFRIFLSMDPDYGEVSRAMRNRCVEVSVLNISHNNPTVFVDHLDTLSRCGLRYSSLASSIVTHSKRISHGNFVDDFKHSNDSTSMFVFGSFLHSMSCRGVESSASFLTLSRLVYSTYVNYDSIVDQEKTLCDTIQAATMISATRVSDEWCRLPSFGCDRWNSRILKYFFGGSIFSQDTTNVTHTDELLSTFCDILNTDQTKIGFLLPFIKLSDATQLLRYNLLVSFLASMELTIFQRCCGYFDRLEGNMKQSARFVSKCATDLLERYDENAKHVQKKNYIIGHLDLMFDRLPQLLKENVWIEQCKGYSLDQKTTSPLSVLHISFLLDLGVVDRSFCRCPLTPIIAPFFRELDHWIQAFLIECWDNVPVENLIDPLQQFLSNRDELWNLLHDTSYCTLPVEFLNFEEATFVTQWCKFYKSWYLLQLNPVFIHQSFSSMKQRRKLDILFESIDSVIFNVSQNSTSILKHTPRPQVPRTMEGWESLISLRRISKECSIDRPTCTSSISTYLTLPALIQSQHAVLFVDAALRRDILGAMSTLHTVVTDEGNLKDETFDVAQRNLPFSDLFTQKIRELQRNFTTKLQKLGFNQSTDQLEQHYSVQELETVITNASVVALDYQHMSHQLLRRFAMIQLSPCFEYWCEWKEKEFLCSLSQMLYETTGLAIRLHRLSSQLHEFISVAIDSSLWTLTDLQPYQILLWVAESEKYTENHLQLIVSGLLSLLITNSTRRKWSNSLNLGQSISKTLELSLMSDVSTQTPHEDYAHHDLVVGLSENRFDQDVPSAVVYSLIGECFKHNSKMNRKSKLCTMENFGARIEQLHDLSRNLACWNFNPDSTIGQTEELFFSLFGTIQSLGKSFSPSIFLELSTILKKPSTLASIDDLKLVALLSTSRNSLLKRLIEPLILPLFHCLRSLSSCDEVHLTKSDDFALAKIYLGLLRFHLTIPDSPLDPGKKPIAKIELIKRQLSTLGLRVASANLESYFLEGDWAMSKSIVDPFILKGKELIVKKKKQEKRVIVRPLGIPSFYELFKETQDFSCTVLSISTICDLVEELRRSSSINKTPFHKENNIQLTSAAFCDRLLTKFTCYEDITSPIVNAIGDIREGLNIFVSNRSGHKRSELMEIVSLFTPFPSLDIAERVRELISLLISPLNSHNGRWNVKLALIFALLSHVRQQRQISGLSSDVIHLFHEILERFIEPSISTFKEDKKIESEDERSERVFREQFPNHDLTFQDLNDDQPPYNTCQDENDHEKSHMDKLELCDDRVDLLSSFHTRIFSDGSIFRSDLDRIETFRLNYDVSCQVYDVLCSESTLFPLCNEIYSGHVMAIGLLTSEFEPSDIECNFHDEPNPRVAMKAARSIERLMVRVTQLASVFQGNAVLTSVAKVTAKVLKLDLYSAPLALFMTGLEAILRHSQDWELHASERVKFGEPLAEISRTISNWRKLELQSWQKLLLAREKKFEQRAKRHWSRMYLVLRDFSRTHLMEQLALCNQTVTTSKRWIWKGSVKDIQQIISFSVDSQSNLNEVIRTFDTFCLTSSLGEFNERLRLLDAFARQTESEANLCSRSSIAVQLARSLRSLWLYYDCFRHSLNRKLDELRKPLEHRLEQDVKLAKWDEQTYYAVAQSSERNHRKLMNVLVDFDVVLERSVAALIEDDLCKGVRESSSSSGESSALIPSANELFPLSRSDQFLREIPYKKFPDIIVDNLSLQKHIVVTEKSPLRKIGHFTNKMESIFHMLTSSKSTSSLGEIEVTDLCDSIFERIDSLRSEKTTRPMKERALVELFRELKRHGYASTKRTIPSELRDLGEIFQLARPNTTMLDAIGLDTNSVEKTEFYYQRCLAEMHRFRSEEGLLGSKFMTPRQIALMTSFSEHGMLLLTQQRSLLSVLLSQRDGLAAMMENLVSRTDSIQLAQSLLHDVLKSHEKDYALSIESMRQFVLFLKSTKHMFTDNERESWVSNTMTNAETLVKMMDIPLQNKSLLIRQSHMKLVKERVDVLSKAETFLIGWRQDCLTLQHVPFSCFDVCATRVDKALKSGKRCLVTPTHITSNCVPFNDLRDNFVESAEKAVERALLTAQACAKDLQSPYKEIETDVTIWACHRSSLRAWASMDIGKLFDSFHGVLATLCAMHDTNPNDNEDQLVGSFHVAIDIRMLFVRLLDVIDASLCSYYHFYQRTAKLEYVLLRVFRVLLAKGFCNEKPNDDSATNENMDTTQMTFEDEKEGTGMGDAEGKNDVTDQLESEDQLLGLQGQQPDENEKGDPEKKLDKDEAEKGMEMENDFEGNLFDIPDTDNEEADNDKQEELDREMGDEKSPNDEVIDEKLWGESDTEEENLDNEETFEDNNATEGEGKTDDMLTRNDDSEEINKSDAPKPNEEKKDEKEDDEDNEANQAPINDTNEEYEENHGVDVRKDEQDDIDKKDVNDMDIDDNLSINDDSENNENDFNDPENDANDPENSECDVNDDVEEQAPDPIDVKPEEEHNEDEPQDDNDPNSQGGTVDKIEDELDSNNDPHDDTPADMKVDPERDPMAGLGVQDRDGRDTVLDNAEEERDGEKGETKDNDSQGNVDTNIDQSNSGGNSSGGHQGKGDSSSSDQSKEIHGTEKYPNPLKSPGDASKFWHRKLNIISSQSEYLDSLETNEVEDVDKTKNADGDFEYTQHETSLQALGEAEEKDIKELKDEECIDQGDTMKKPYDRLKETEEIKSGRSSCPRLKTEGPHDSMTDDIQDNVSMNAEEDHLSDNDMSQCDIDDNFEITSDGMKLGNKVVSDHAQLHSDNMSTGEHSDSTIEPEDVLTSAISMDVAKAREQWAVIQNDTHYLSRRLCEKLRLVLEPLVASKLRGDYRTGKRINMKRVIGYIASGYRKDKIWLRRTKPAKRNYRVLLAVDDSESMLKSGAGKTALKAMATLAVGMSQLEVGEIGIASFGNEMNLIHPFHIPFTSESGANVVLNFRFNQQRTRTSLCVQSALMALDNVSMAGGYGSTSMQLVFIISDGRIERDSRSTLRRLIREMMERNIMIVMIIVEGHSDGIENNNRNNDRIMNMKEVTFLNGKPVVKRFIEDYPFPYYIVLDDMQTLPEVLGDALRQWFEMLNGLQGSLT